MRTPPDPMSETETTPEIGGNYGIYVHVPYCRTRCPYCAFVVFIADNPAWQAWADGICAEWDIRRHFFPGHPHSIYFGGGTPSLCPPAILRQVLAHLPHDPTTEITLEVNPGSVDLAGLGERISLGVNRLSLGVQTFHPQHAKRLGRGHTIAAARRLLRALPGLSLRSWSFDLIFGLPDQTMLDLDSDLAELCSFAPPHVSLYGLSYEPGTPLTRAKEQGLFKTCPPDLWADQYARILEVLSEAGLQRYEVSNYARPGHRSVHNEAVWRGGVYAGLGPGAHGFLPSGHRTRNHPDLTAWQTDLHGEIDLPSPTEAALDLLLSTLRHEAGLPRARLARLGFMVDPKEEAVLCRGGMIEASPTHLRLRAAAFPLADGVVRRLSAKLLPLPNSS